MARHPSLLYTEQARGIEHRSAKAGYDTEHASRSYDDNELSEWKNDGRLSTAWITYRLERKAYIDDICLKLTGWRLRSYPLEVYAGKTLIWSGETERSLGYIHLTPTKRVKTDEITIRLKGAGKDKDAFGGIVEVAEPAAGELDLFKAKNGGDTKSELRIVEIFGIGKHGKGDVIFNTPTPYLDLLTATSAHSQLQASGEDVGLPDGQMGNSEVGHLNIGAGRIVYQDLVKINRACKDGSIMENPQVKAAYSYAKENGKKLHLMGLCSDGGVHSSLDHLFKLIEIGKAYGLKNQLFVHCYMDGRDTDPKSGKGFIEQVTKVCADNDAAIASIVGRFYAMDRDKRWERVKEGYDLIVNGTGKQATDMVQAMQESYDEGVTDEFIKPIHNASVNGCIEEGDVVIFINFRNDRAKEMTIVLTQEDMPEQGMKTIPGLQYYCMTPYDANFKGVHILFPKENVENTLGEYLSRQGKKQLHTAETEKYAHVTFFFNGGREAPYEGEDRILVPSPKVATYDLKPEMSAYEVKDKLVAAINEAKYDFIVVNFANGDMVGHTGVYNAIAKAVWAVDNCVREVIEAAKANDYEAIIIADHGNADNAINADGTPNTAHSLNPVPFIYVTNNNSATVKDGRLADVAPSILHIMGLEQPADMTGECLIEDNK